MTGGDGGGPSDALGGIRARIEALDGELMELIAERVALANDAGSIKRERGLAPRDFVIERAVVDRYRRGFEERSLDPRVGERIAHELFTETLRAQEAETRSTHAVDGERVLIVGGAGRMGAWLARYLDGIGYAVVTNDVDGSLPGFPSTDDLVTAARAADVVLVSVPPDAVASVLERLRGIETPVIDVASLKAPFSALLTELARDQPVASVHPMWGPETQVLSDKYLLVCDCGHPGATAVAERVFAPTLATLVDVPLEQHDEAMAYTQVLPQALGLLHAEVLTKSSFTMEELDERGGRSFAQQASVTRDVVGRDPLLYRQIQELNTHAPAVYDRIREALDRLERDRGDPGAFADALRRYRTYLDGQLEARHP